MAGLLAALDWAGFVKINLNAAEWRHPGDPARFIEACTPEIITGDPLSFAALARLPVAIQPKALVSTAMSLSPGLRQDLETRFGCFVLDIYSLNEAGPVAVREREGDRLILLQPHLYVEILDENGLPCPPGACGEITLTGGFNRLLPLLRYRTGDTAALVYRGTEPILVGLSGRPPVVFFAADGRRVNNVDASNALRPFPIGHFTLHQAADGALTLRIRAAAVSQTQLREVLADLFGATQPLTIIEESDLVSPAGKVVQYTSEMANDR